MTPVSYARHQFPTVLIQHAVWLYLRFTLSYRDVEDLLAERGIEVSYETVRRWVLKFGPVFAQRLRRFHPKPSRYWHLDAPRAGATTEQPGGEFAPADPATRTQDAGLQVARLGSTLPGLPRRRP